LTTSSSEVEERASSINRRSSLYDQRRLRTIRDPFCSGQGRQAEYVRLAVSPVGRSGLREIVRCLNRYLIRSTSQQMPRVKLTA
jgi:hypothetical protein